MIAPRTETVGQPGDPAPAPFTRTILPNGLRVLVRANPALPLMAIDCWVGVGALGETDEHAGVSHFFEHMLFKGTGRYPLGTMDRLVKEMGGYNNAATSMEYTHYYIVAPSEHLALALDLLADHLTDPALPAPELDRERQVVKEEIRRKDDSPRGRLYTALSQTAFGTTPYAREILGTPESLDRITPDVMRAYWSAGYRADRLIVAIAGDVDPGAVTDAVAARLGHLRPAETRPPSASLPTVPSTRVELEMDVSQAYLAWAYGTAGRDDLEELCALEVAATILGEGMTSRLYRRLIDDRRVATSVSSWTYGLDRIGLFGIDAVCAPARRDEVEAEIVDVLQAALDHGLSQAEVRRAQATLAADFAYDNETNAALTGTMGEFELLHGFAGAYRDVLAGIAAVTPDSATEALRRRVEPEGGVRAWIGPDGA